MRALNSCHHVTTAANILMRPCAEGKLEPKTETEKKNQQPKPLSAGGAATYVAEMEYTAAPPALISNKKTCIITPRQCNTHQPRPDERPTTMYYIAAGSS